MVSFTHQWPQGLENWPTDESCFDWTWLAEASPPQLVCLEDLYCVQGATAILHFLTKAFCFWHFPSLNCFSMYLVLQTAACNQKKQKQLQLELLCSTTDKIIWIAWSPFYILNPKYIAFPSIITDWLTISLYRPCLCTTNEELFTWADWLDWKSSTMQVLLSSEQPKSQTNLSILEVIL